MTTLIAGFGDLGLAIAGQAELDAYWRDQPIVAIKRSLTDVGHLSNVSCQYADMLNSEAVESVLSEVAQSGSIDYVVYCAAPSERTPAAYRRTYVTGLQNLVSALDALAQPNRPRLLFVSSTAVYDSQSSGVFTEASPTEPSGFNGQVLCEAETWLQARWPKATILRLSGIYGPTKQRLLQSIVCGAASVPPSLDYIANRIHINDAARAVLHLLRGGHQGIFLGTDSTPLPLATLYTKLAELLNAPVPTPGDPSPMMGKKCLSNQKLLDTGFVFQWPDCLAGYAAIIDQQRSQSRDSGLA